MPRIKRSLYWRAFSKVYSWEREPSFLEYYARQVEASPAFAGGDVVFSPGTIPIAYLQTSKPIVFWTDATFAGMLNFYPGWTNLATETIRSGNRAEQLALSKCRIAIYRSQWAANSAVEHYDVDPAKIRVVPFGANIDRDRTANDIMAIADAKNFGVCKLLFVGVDWSRKGGGIAVSVAEALNNRGILSELHVVGCNPPYTLPPYVVRHGFISKASSEGRGYLNRLMTDSHFLILPSRAECAAVVLAEASSFRLPSLATRVGGIPEVVHDHKNGLTFPLDADPNSYCDYIERLMSSDAEYRQLALSTFAEYHKRLNWPTAGRKVIKLLQEYRCWPSEIDF